MSERRPPRDDAIDAGLRDAISWVFPDEIDGFEPPSDDIIQAYVEGRATDEQVTLVEEAMVQSASFMETIIMLRQVEEDFAGQGSPDREAADEDPMQEPREPHRVLGIRWGLGWFWRPQLGYGIAAAMLLVMLARIGIGDRSVDLQQPGVQVVALAAQSSNRSGQTSDVILVLPGSQRIDIVLEKAVPGSFLSEYRVTPELRRMPGNDLIPVGGVVRAVPVGDGSAYLAWTIPAESVPTGLYSVSFEPFLESGAPVEVDEHLEGRFEVRHIGD